MKRLVFVMIPIALIYTIAALPDCAVDAAQRHGHWQRLGEAEVGFAKRHDHDRIDVPRKAGPFRELRVEVRGGPIEISEMVVTFGNGEKFKARIPERLAEGQDYVIDLPGKRHWSSSTVARDMDSFVRPSGASEDIS